ncbi:hypothetical protein [Marinimicrococcus flavescens]|uniref:Uncharacterized protein n=1 Tax=Marinimicrococcus flavescens TaxID=3031815 RepID=A0AAP3V064_9PROT|nr:hypothetical protein [Marinimicrococcus flavescens]
MNKPQPEAAALLRPATFAERGVAVPFTTPVMNHARIRPSRSGHGELLVPNPSGARGLYVLPLDGAERTFSLTVHDRLLLEELSRVQALTPQEIRHASRRVAMMGTAGREAARAATEAGERDQTERLLVNVLLLDRLFRQTGFMDFDWRRIALQKRDIRERLRGEVGRLGPQLGMRADEILNMLEEISIHAATVGLPDVGFVSRAQTALKMLGRFDEELRAWAALETGAHRETANLVMDCASFTLQHGRSAIDKAHAILADVIGLVRTWRANSETIAERLALAEWLLDGWQQIAAIWEASRHEERPARRMTLGEIASMLPVLPKDAVKHLDDAAAPAIQSHRRRWVRLHEDWRTGSIVAADATQRNEAVRILDA